MRSAELAGPEGSWAMVKAAKLFCDRYTSLCGQSLAPLGLTAAQSEILLYLYQRPNDVVENQELLMLLQISPAALSATLKRLRQKGFIRCSIHGRKKSVSLTVRALEIQGQLDTVMSGLENAAFNQVADQERESARYTLEKITQNLSDYAQSDPASQSL